MKMIAITAAALGLVAAATPIAASAQGGWRPIAQRQANLDQRIDQGIRSGRLNRPEARRIQNELRQLDRLEAQYRRSNGLSMSERRDLDAATTHCRRGCASRRTIASRAAAIAADRVAAPSGAA